MKKLLLFAGLVFVFSCNYTEEEREVRKMSPREMQLVEIKSQEVEMGKSMDLDPGRAELAVNAYVSFVQQFPDDSLSPDFLFKAAEISTAVGSYEKALLYYKQITGKYDHYKLYPESLYLQANLLDNYLNDDAAAKIIYEQVILKFPDSAYANDAKAAINNLGKSDEELIKEFKKKNRK